jgi:hypothetical protein
MTEFSFPEEILLNQKAFHSSSFVDVISPELLSFKVICKNNEYSRINLIVFIDDMPIVKHGNLIYRDEKSEYYLFKFETQKNNNTLLYYFELNCHNGEVEYLGKNGVYNEEWRIESFEYFYQPASSKIVDINQCKKIMEGILILNTEFSKKLKEITDELKINYIVTEKTQNNEEKSGKFNVLTLEKLASKFFFIKKEILLELSNNFQNTIKNFFVEKSIQARELVATLGKDLFFKSITQNLLKLNIIDNIPFKPSNTEEISIIKLLLAFQVTYTGIPAISSRSIESFPDEIVSFYKNLLNIRRMNHILNTGDIRFVFSNDDVFGFERIINESDKVLIFFNRSKESFTMDVTSYLGNGDFIDISKEHPLKRKRMFSLYPEDFVILRKVRER